MSEIENLKELPIHTKQQIKNDKNGKTVLTEDLEIHIIEIPKINRMLENGKLKKWILFLENPEGEETKRMAEKEKEIKEAIETLEDISSDEEKERIAELRQKYIMDRKSEIRTAKEIGVKEGLEEGIKMGIEKAIETLEDVSSDEAKESIAELRQKYIMDRKSEIRTAKEIGVKEGLEEGMEKGSKNEKIEIAKKMLNENMKIEVIERITGLKKTEIEEL